MYGDPPTKFRPGHLSAPKVDVVWVGSRTVRDAGGSRTHLDRVAAGGRAVWLQRQDFSVLARDRTWSSTFAESRAIQHTPRTSSRGAAQTTPSGVCLSRRLPAHHFQLRRCCSVLPPHTGWRPPAARFRRSPTGRRAGTCPTWPWSCPSAGR